MEDKRTWKTRPIIDVGMIDAEVEERDSFASRVCTMFSSQNLRVVPEFFSLFSLFLHRDKTDSPRWLAKLREWESTKTLLVNNVNPAVHVPCHTANA